MGTGKFLTVYPGKWTEREKPYAEEYFAKIKELEDRGPIDVQALISGKIAKGTQGFSNVLHVKEDMMLYNANKYDPDNKLYTDDAYAQAHGFKGKIAMPAFAAHDDSFLTAFNGKARDFLCVSGLHHYVTQLAPVYAGDDIYLVKDKLQLFDLTPEEGSDFRNLYLRTYGSGYNQNGEKVIEVMFSARENLRSYEDPADMKPGTRAWLSPDWWERPQHKYTAEDWEEIYQIWANENPRGDEPLYWEDVNVGDMPNVTLDGPIHTSAMPQPDAPFGMATNGSRTMKELADPEVRAKNFTLNEEDGLYYPHDMTEWNPKVPDFRGPDWKMPAGGPPPADPNAKPKRAVFINFMGRDFAIHHINNWMGSHGWIKNIRWGIMTDPIEQGFHFPKNPEAIDMVTPVPALKGRKSITHGLQFDCMKIHSQVYDKYEKDGKHYVELGFWITTINDEEMYEEGGATIELPSKND